MRPLVILHGLFGSSQNWASISPKIASEYNRVVHALDLRNHNCPPDSIGSKISSWHTFSNDLEEFWERKLDCGQFDLLGHSLGGQIAMNSVLRKSSLVRKAVRKLVIVDISLRRPVYPRIDDDKMYVLMQKMSEIDALQLPSRSRVADELKKVEYNVDIINFLLLNLRKDPNTNAFSFSKLALNELISAWPALVESWNTFKCSEFVPWTGQTLFICGEKSDYVTDRDVSEIEEFFPNSQIKMIPNSGHWPHFDNPSDFNRILKMFLLKE